MYAAVVLWVVGACGAVNAAAVVVKVDEAVHVALEDGLVGRCRGGRGVEVGRQQRPDRCVAVRVGEAERRGGPVRRVATL